ncbi:hypothetical protein [Agromyces lapidis]|uniref:Transmembrane protein n=1 Tax=Agromyces lapidis TaxID=279574 RepID=A0ABV5SSB2_9MICO|nr:hypothetical protein [Agromyces lapidis]
MTSAPEPTRPSLAKQLLWGGLAVGVGVPLCLGAWIGLVLAGDRLGWSLTADGIFAWLMAALVALLLWPIAIRGSQRQFWHFRGRRPGEPVRWGAEPTAPVPKVRLTAGDRWVRAAIALVGALSLLAICGPQAVTLALLGALDAASAGARSWWLALQLGAFIVMLALVFPVLWATERAIRRRPDDDPARERLELAQSWYLGAALAWVMCAIVGFLISFMILRYLAYV